MKQYGPELLSDRELVTTAVNRGFLMLLFILLAKWLGGSQESWSYPCDPPPPYCTFSAWLLFIARVEQMLASLPRSGCSGKCPLSKGIISCSTCTEVAVGAPGARACHTFPWMWVLEARR